MQKSEMLTLLDQKVCACTKCPDLVASRKQTVFGEGNPDATVVFMGEAPGRTEDEEGRPFCGQAGKLLDNIIKSCGWERQDVYILNTVKCHPEHNRVPSPEEATNCRGFLDLQLKVINPKIIVCLGATAAQSLLNINQPVSKLRNSWYHYLKAKVRVTFHPAYLLRNPKEKTKTWEDMQAVLDELKK
jgi:uracil-DNA glycosylase